MKRLSIFIFLLFNTSILKAIYSTKIEIHFPFNQYQLNIAGTASLDSILKRLSPNAFPIVLPIGFEKEINGVVDLINMKSYTYKDFTDKEFTIGEVPADMVEKCKEYRHRLMEKVVETAKDAVLSFIDNGIQETMNSFNRNVLE